MSEKKPRKPLPRVDEENKWFWEAASRHELYVQKCGGCGTVRFYPRALCPECLSSDTEYVRCSGRGRVHTFTVTHQNQAPGFRGELPYVMAYVELDEGPRLLTNVVGSKPEEMRIGMPVVVEFEDVEDGMSLPKFRKA
ncbi:MAG: Zn-ribbon domain-containing OB-fold protein [Candidatus Binatia bacterium]